MKTLRNMFICGILILASSSYATELVYEIPVTYGDVVGAVERLANEPRTKPFKVPNLPAIIEGKDIVVETYAKPSVRYYRGKAYLDTPMGRMHKFDKQIEVWGKPDKYIIKGSVDIGWTGFDRCSIVRSIKNRIISKAECMVLQMEKKKIMEYASRIETVEVEKPGVSWGSILYKVWDIGVDILTKIDDKKVAD